MKNAPAALRGFIAAACCALAAACASDPAPAPQSHIPNAQAGYALAQANCASCHAIEAGQAQSPNPAAPAFASVANTPGVTPIALNVWMHVEHPTMPDFILEQEKVDDVIAYIFELKED